MSEAYTIGGGGAKYPTANASGKKFSGNGTVTVQFTKTAGKRYYAVCTMVNCGNYNNGNGVWFIDTDNTVTRLVTTSGDSESPYCTVTDTTVTLGGYDSNIGTMVFGDLIPIDE